MYILLAIYVLFGLGVSLGYVHLRKAALLAWTLIEFCAICLFWPVFIGYIFVVTSYEVKDAQ